MVKKSWLLGTLTLALALSGCGARPSEEYSRRLKGTVGPALHAVHNDRLREIMKELEGVVLEQFSQELDPKLEKQQKLESVARVAWAMGDAAVRIPEILTGVELSPPQRELFRALSQRLGEEAMDLSEAALRGDLPAARVSLDRIDLICRDCHQRFRVLPALPPGTGSRFWIGVDVSNLIVASWKEAGGDSPP